MNTAGQDQHCGRRINTAGQESTLRVRDRHCGRELTLRIRRAVSAAVIATRKLFPIAFTADAMYLAINNCLQLEFFLRTRDSFPVMLQYVIEKRYFCFEIVG